MGVDEYTQLREASVEDWSTWIYAKMSKAHAESPEQILPQILSRMEQRCAQISREAAKLAAREIVDAKLRKAIAS
jgi:hypothetical protein